MWSWKKTPLLNYMLYTLLFLVLQLSSFSQIQSATMPDKTSINCKDHIGLTEFKSIVIEVPKYGQVGKWLPVTISFETYGSTAITGRWHWQSDQNRIYYHFSMTTTAQTKKKLYHYIYITNLPGKLTLSLDYWDKSTYYQTWENIAAGPDTAQILVLTSSQSMERNDHIDWISGKNIDTSFMPNWQCNLFYGNTASLPDYWVGLEALDAIILDDLSTEWGNLSSAQMQALHEYVQNGGVLYLCGGANEAHLLDPQMQDFLPVTLSDRLKISPLPDGSWTEAPLSTINTSPTKPPSTSSSLALQLRLCQPHADSKVLLKVNQHPAVISKNYGEGIVFFIACSFADPYWTNLKYIQTRMNRHPCESRPLLAQWAAMQMKSDLVPKTQLTHLTQQKIAQHLPKMSGVQVPAVEKIIFFVVIYICIIAGLLGCGYFLQYHKIAIFLTIVTTVLFLAIIRYVEVSTLSLAAITRDSFSFLYTTPHTPIAKVYHGISLTSNRNRICPISLKTSGLYLFPAFASNAFSSRQNFFTSWNIEAGQPYQWNLVQLYHQTPTIFYAQGTTSIGQGLDCQLSIQNNQVVGMITNNTSIEWQDLHFYVGKQIGTIGKLMPGQTLSVHTDLKPWDTIKQAVIWQNPWMDDIGKSIFADNTLLQHPVLLGWSDHDFLNLTSDVGIAKNQHTTILFVSLPHTQQSTSPTLSKLPSALQWDGGAKILHWTGREWVTKAANPPQNNTWGMKEGKVLYDIQWDYLQNLEKEKTLQISLDQKLLPTVLASTNCNINLQFNSSYGQLLVQHLQIYIFDVTSKDPQRGWKEVKYVSSRSSSSLWAKYSPSWSIINRYGDEYEADNIPRGTTDWVIHLDNAVQYICPYSGHLWLKFQWNSQEYQSVKFRDGEIYPQN